MLSEYARLVLDDGQHDREFHSAVRQLLAHASPDTMDRFISGARQRLPALRMLYIDASILKALAMPEHTAKERIATLDDAIIVAGAADDDTRRDYVVHDVIRQLQCAISPHVPSNAVFVAAPVPVPPLPTSRNGVHARTTLPSIVAADKHWSRAPFVIRGHADDWPAMHQPHQWASIPYLFSVSGPGRTVPVEVGVDYRSDDWSPKLMSWDVFLSSLDPSLAPQHTIYLAQHSLLSQFPQLREDIILPDIVYASLSPPDFPTYKPPPNVIINAWLGPKGTISPAHTDPYFNCYVQVVGRKTVWLAPPNLAAAMYPSGVSSFLGNTSRVDVFPATAHEIEASQSAFPLFWNTVPGQASCVTLYPGDLLFFPPGWWHAMRSEDVSFSVSMWF